MKKKLLVASLLALVAMGSLWLYSRSLEDEKAGGQKVAILVAAEDIPAGTRIKKNQIAMREVPEAYVHQASLKKNDINDIIGHPVADKIAQGQPLLWSDFDAKKSSSSRRLSTAIQKGQRAITIPVDIAGSLAGMLRPGDHVDIMGTFARNQGQDWATVTLLQNVLVLATGDMRGGAAEGDEAQVPGGGPRTFSNITVSVDLEEAELLVFSMQRGPVSVALRSQDDLETAEDVPDKTFGDIFETARRTAFAKRRAKKIEALRTQ